MEEIFAGRMCFNREKIFILFFCKKNLDEKKTKIKIFVLKNVHRNTAIVFFFGRMVKLIKWRSSKKNGDKTHCRGGFAIQQGWQIFLNFVYLRIFGLD